MCSPFDRMGARRLGRIHQIRETRSNTPKWGLPGKSKLFQRCYVKEDMFFSLTEKQVQLKKKYSVSKLNSAGIQNKGNKSKPNDWLRFISVILIGTFSSSSRLKFPTQFFLTSAHHQGWAWWKWLQLCVSSFKGHRFFHIKVLSYQCF